MELDKLDFENPTDVEDMIIWFNLTDNRGKAFPFTGRIHLPRGYYEAAEFLYQTNLDGKYDEPLPGGCLTDIIATHSAGGLLEFKLRVLVPRLEKNPWRVLPFAREYRPVREEINEPGVIGTTVRAYLNQFKDVPIVPDENTRIPNGAYRLDIKYASGPNKEDVIITGPLTIREKGTILAE